MGMSVNSTFRWKRPPLRRREWSPCRPARAFSVVWSLGDLGPYNLPAFYMDRFEVTNRQYQEFVDKGGYQKREYWKEKFLLDGKELSWEQAMDLLRDSTGRPGPCHLAGRALSGGTGRLSSGRSELV